MWMDLVNGLFEAIGAACVLMNVRALLRDRHIAGVHWAPTVFFTAWGAWNVVYYPTLDQWFSTAGGSLLLLANLWWIFLVWRFRPRAIGTLSMNGRVIGKITSLEISQENLEIDRKSVV